MFLNLWLPHALTWLSCVRERLHSALQSKLPTRAVVVRPCNTTPLPLLSAYETVIGLVPEHVLVPAPHLSPSCPNVAACCLCKTPHEIVLIQNQLADSLDSIDWKELKTRLGEWSVFFNCAVMALSPAEAPCGSPRVPLTQPAPPSNLISWVNWFDASTPTWPALNDTIVATLGTRLGQQLTETRDFDRFAGALGIIPKHLPGILKWSARSRGPKQPCSQKELDSLILQLRGQLLWGLYRRYSYRNHLFSQWWLSEDNEDYRYTVTGMQVDSILKATKRRNEKAQAAFVSSRKKRRISIKGNWVEDLENIKLSRLNTTYCRGVNLRTSTRKPVYTDETLALESREEFIRKLMDKQKRQGHPLLSAPHKP